MIGVIALIIGSLLMCVLAIGIEIRVYYNFYNSKENHTKNDKYDNYHD